MNRTLRFQATVLACLLVSGVLAAVAMAISALRGSTGIDGMGMGSLLRLYAAIGATSSLVLGVGVALLPQTRIAAALLGSVLGCALSLHFSLLPITPPLGSRESILHAIIFAIIFAPLGVLVHNGLVEPDDG